MLVNLNNVCTHKHMLNFNPNISVNNCLGSIAKVPLETGKTENKKGPTYFSLFTLINKWKTEMLLEVTENAKISTHLSQSELNILQHYNN